MKRIAILIIVLLSVTALRNQSFAQANWELGIRYGDRGSVEATIPLGIAPRLKPAFYFADRVGAAAFFDWMFSLSGGPTGLKFFPGVGAEMFFDPEFDFAATGDLGAEYTFTFPITIGFDWRPAIFFTNDRGFEADHWGFSARWRFGEKKVKLEKTQ